MTSGERGTNVMVTSVHVMSPAPGNIIPSMFVFPRKKSKNNFTSGGSPDYVGTSNINEWV